MIKAEEIHRCGAEPVSAELREGLLDPFASATLMTLKEMAGIEATVRSMQREKEHRMYGDISAVIGLMVKTEGAMVISFNDAFAVAMTKRILAGINDEPATDVVRDCVGEVANVIVGQARGLLANGPFSFAMSTPTVVSGPTHEIRHKPGMSCLVTAFSTELGDFAVQLCLSI